LHGRSDERSNAADPKMRLGRGTGADTRKSFASRSKRFPTPGLSRNRNVGRRRFRSQRSRVFTSGNSTHRTGGPPSKRARPFADDAAAIVRS
jgi:hypothetical protein